MKPIVCILALNIFVLNLLCAGAAVASPNDHGDISRQRALFAYLKVQPGTEARFLEAAKDVITKSRREPGNLVYVLNQSISDPQQFVFYELFESEDALQAHRNSPHVAGFLKNVNPILLPGQFILNEMTVAPAPEP